jgi:hypothetical protein
MAKKKKRGGKRESRREVQGAIEDLEVVEKDVGRVRANLQKFLVEAEKFLSGGSHHIPPTRPPRKKIPRR